MTSNDHNREALTAGGDERPGTLAEILARRSETDRDRRVYTFLRDGEDDEVVLTFDGLHRRALQLAGLLDRHGRPRERVLMLCPQDLTYVCGFFGCLYADMIPVPLFTPHPSRIARLIPRLMAVVRDAGASLVLTDRAGLHALRPLVDERPELQHLEWLTVDDLDDDTPMALPRFPSRESVAFIQYTSGSTGTPRGVMVSHGNLMHNLLGIVDTRCSTRDSVGVTWCPIFHDFGLICGLLTAVYRGYHNVFLSPLAFLKRPFRWLRAISKYRGTVSEGPNFGLELCVARTGEDDKKTLDLSSWRHVSLGAEPLRPETLRRFYAAFRDCGLPETTLHPSYGLAEITVFASSGHLHETARSIAVKKSALEEHKVELCSPGPDAVELSLCGRPRPDTRVRIVDPESRTVCAEDRVGEIWLHNDSVALGYWGRPEESEKTFRATVANTGEGPFLRTGDLGFVHDGHLVITGRIKDMIIVRGLNHYPHDIELTVERSHPGARPGCTAAFSVDIDGEERLVVVQEVDRARYERHTRGRDPRAFAFPEAALAAARRCVLEAHDLEAAAVVFIEPGSLPKTSSGKVRRRRCRQRLLAGELAVIARWQAIPVKPETGRSEPSAHRSVTDTSSAPLRPGVEDISQWLLAEIAARKGHGPEAVKSSRTFADLGLDSVAAVGLVGDLERWLGRNLPPTLLWDFPTVDILAAELARGESATHRLGELLIAAGRVSERELENALREQTARAESGRRSRLGDILVDRGWVIPHDLDRALERQQQARRRADGPVEPIAIIGIGCRFPGDADAPESFWENLLAGRNAITKVPGERWDADALHDPDPEKPGRMVCKWGGFLSAIDRFDPRFFGISPREARAMDPQHRLLLEVSWEALEHAAIAPDSLHGTRTGVFVGITSNDYGRLTALADARHLDAYYGIGNAASAAAGRISYTLGLQGPSMTLDAACASSLLTVHEACESIRRGECSVALAGGVNLILTPELSMGFSRAGMLSPSGQCRAFDADADGYVRSEGCGLVVLKSLARARADRDRILAVIRGSAVNQDGRSSGITAPNGRAQSRVIREALDRAGVRPSEVDYVEAHGAGTPLGDPIEVAALMRVYGDGRAEDHPLVVGTVKSNIGHTEAAAGIAGLLKTVGALLRETIPETLNLRRCNPDIADSPGLSFATATRPWPAGDRPRLAGVSSFGFIGTNVHLVVEEAPRLPIRSPDAERPLHILAMSAPDASALRALAGRHARALAAPEGARDGDGDVLDLADLCWTANSGRAHFAHRATLIGSNRDEMRDQAEKLARGSTAACPISGAAEKAEVAMLFTGVDMMRTGRELFATQPLFRRAVERCAAALPAGFDLLADVASDRPVAGRDAADEPRRFALEWSLYQLWRAWGVSPRLLFGLGLGTYAAACAAGLLSADHVMTCLATGRHSDIAAGLETWIPTAEVVMTRSARVMTREELATVSVGTDEAGPPRWRECASLMEQRGCRALIELAPLAATDESLRDQWAAASERWISSLHPNRPAWRQLLPGLGTLYTLGVDIDWANFDRGYERRKCAAPGYPFQRERYWLDPGGGAVSAPAEEADIYRLDWRLDWVPADPRAASSGPEGHWLVIGDAGGLRGKLASALRDLGCDVTAAEIGEDWRSGAEPYRGVVYLGDVADSDAITPESLRAEQRRLAGGFLQLVQALVTASTATPPRLWLVTRGSQKVQADDSVALSRCPLWGLAQTVHLEHPELFCTRVDLPGLQIADDATDAVAVMVAELSGTPASWDGDFEEAIAYRRGRRYLARLTAIDLAERIAPGSELILGDGWYVITGGRGALGLQVAEHLVARGARRLLLLGRSSADSAVQDELRSLRDGGVEVETVRADVGDDAEMAALFAGWRRQGRRLRGIIHAAGVIDDGALVGQTVERMMTAMAAKVWGAWNVYRGARAAEVDFLILFSSMAALVGNPGQGTYAAGNAFLDGLAHHGRGDGIPVVSIAWGPWAGSGMAGSGSARLGDAGIGLIDPAAALRALDRALLAREPHIGVARVDWDKYFADPGRTSPRPLLENFAPAPAARADKAAPGPIAAHTAGELATRLAETPPHRRPGLLLEAVRGTVAEFLGENDSRSVDVRRRFRDLGVDSLMAVRIRNALGQLVGRHLPATLALNYPTITEVAGYLAAEVFTELFADGCAVSAHDDEDRGLADEIAALSADEAAARLGDKLDAILGDEDG